MVLRALLDWNLSIHEATALRCALLFVSGGGVQLLGSICHGHIFKWSPNLVAHVKPSAKPPYPDAISTLMRSIPIFRAGVPLFGEISKCNQKETRIRSGHIPNSIGNLVEPSWNLNLRPPRTTRRLSELRPQSFQLLGEQT